MVEIMIVVAIIGVLAAMSAGTFQKQLARSRQAEAKSSLSSMFTAQKAFQAEYNCFWSGFTTIAYSIEGKLRYNMGFSTASSHTLGAGGCGYTGPSTSAAPASTNAYCATTGSNCQSLSSAGTLSTGSATVSTFTAQAIGSIFNTLSDAWIIDQGKNLTQTQDGIQ